MIQAVVCSYRLIDRELFVLMLWFWMKGNACRAIQLVLLVWRVVFDEGQCLQSNLTSSTGVASGFGWRAMLVVILNVNFITWKSCNGHQQLRSTRNYIGAWRTWRRPHHFIKTSSLLLDWSCRRTRRRRLGSKRAINRWMVGLRKNQFWYM